MGWKDAPVVEEKQPAWATAPAVESPAPATVAPQAYKPFATVRKDIDPKSLNTDPDWLNASRLMYEMWERKPFEGTDEQLAEWGKDSMGNFNFNLVSMAQIANTVTKATQLEKEAFLWMMDTYDNTNMSWEGAGRAVKGIATDPTTYVGVGTLGAGLLMRQGGKVATKQGLRETLMQSLGRTGITAGIEGGVYSGVQSTVEQGVEVSAGRRDGISVGKTAVDIVMGATAGVVLGTAADATVTKIVSTIKGARTAPTGTPSVTPKVTPEGAADAPKAPNIPGATKAEEAVPTPKVDTEAPTVATRVSPETPAEATQRQQSGRLRADETVPDVTTTVRAIDVPEFNTGLRTTRLTDEPAAKIGNTELNTLADPVVIQLRETPTAELPAVLEKARMGSYTPEQFRVLARAFENFSFELKKEIVTLKAEQNVLAKKANLTPEESVRFKDLTDRITELETRASAPALTDDAVGSFAGTLLQDRQGPMSKFSKITPESIAKEQNVSMEKAEEIFAEMINKANKAVEAEKIAADYAPKIQQALDAGDFVEATRLAQEKSRLMDAITNEVVPESSSWVRKATEWAISNVFTVKTLFMNVIPSGIKSVMIPAVKAIVKNPLEKAARVEMAATYSAMRATFKSALKASVEAFKYEQALLTRDSNRLLETGMAITGKFGGAVRLFPRLLNATDEFLSQINYAAYVAGRAAGDAFAEGTEKGLKGKALDNYVEKAIEKARKASFEGNTGDDLINPIIAKGLNLGYTGDDLFRYVEKELLKVKDLSLLQRGTDDEALNFVRDVLYKRDFSGKGNASQVAQKADEVLREWPSIKIITGQLFFRTPVRVFEEGVRLTPGLNILAPNFMKDLTGGNGTLRQVRAQGEALVGLGMVGMILSLYGQGRVTGDGAYENYHQQKLRGDGPKQEPYTIKMSDGSTWSYRNFDPIATPIKIIVNALERFDKLRLREAQGEFVDAKAYEKPLALLSIAAQSISRAFIDAGLTEGINQMIKISEMMADPEGKDDATVKYLGEKLKLIVPNTLRKIARENDPTIKDPATFWQMIEQNLLGPIQGTVGADPKLSTAYSYDVLGNVRRAADTGYIFDFFTTNSVEERARGMSPEAQFVMQELDRLGKVTGATFKPPIKHRELGDTDLRTIMAADGKRTLYDVWQENYRSLRPEDSLYPLLAADLPDGTMKYKGARVEAVRDVINQLQDAAFQMTMAQEEKVLDRFIKETIKKTNAKAGLY